MLFFLELLYLLIILPIEVHRWPILWPIFMRLCNRELRLEQLLRRKAQRRAPTIGGNYILLVMGSNRDRQEPRRFGAR
jgi:hypothetical protein